MNNIKIIVATHKLAKMPKDSSLYMPLHVGAEGKIGIGYTGDNLGENISVLNPYYCELTGLYWAWKNLDCEYLGLVHYRRYFAKYNKRYSENIQIDEIVLSKQDINNLLFEYDVILPKKRKYYIETLYSHYAHTFDENHLNIARDIIKQKFPSYLESFDKVMKFRGGYMFNMFIMKKSLADDYCKWLFPILDIMYSRVDLSEYSVFESRLFGRVSEILFNVWLIHNSIKFVEVPFIYMDKVNLKKKIISFLKAKFLGIKYKESF